MFDELYFKHSMSNVSRENMDCSFHLLTVCFIAMWICVLSHCIPWPAGQETWAKQVHATLTV